MLQGVDLQHHVKRSIVKQRQTFVQVQLNDVDAALHTSQHIGIINFDAVAGAMARCLQVCQQRTVATAQIKHA